MRLGNSSKKENNRSKKKQNKFNLSNIKDFLKPSSYLDVLMARIISPRLNIGLNDARELGSDIMQRLTKIESVSDLYPIVSEFSTIRFGEQFNIPFSFNSIKRVPESFVTPNDLGLTLEKQMPHMPYGIIAVLGGPDSGKTSLVNYLKDYEEFETITAMEPIVAEEEPFVVGPTASCLALVGTLYLQSAFIIFDSARFVRGVSDYGLGEKGLPIGVSLFLTDINNLLVWARKRVFLVVSTESNNENYNQAYYELLRGAVNGIIQPITGSQAGYIEYKPSSRRPTLYKYGEGAHFETVENIFELKTNFLLGDRNEKN